jgi:hypothetical protein
MSQKKTVASITRSAKHPRVAYIIIPMGMVPDVPYVDVMANQYGDIALKFHLGGDSRANKTSKQSATIRVTFPASVTKDLPIGTFECDLVRNGDMFRVVRV